MQPQPRPLLQASGVAPFGQYDAYTCVSLRAFTGGGRGAPHAEKLTWTGDGSSLSSTLAWVQERRAVPNARDKAYVAFLRALADWGLLSDLPGDGSGTLHVSLPFCGGCSETPLLLPYLADRLLGRFGTTGISVYGCDVDPEPAKYWWLAWEEWAAHTYGSRVKLQLRRQDLAREPLPPPPAGLVLGVHPAVVQADGGEGPWREILANVLRSRAPGGRCIFATFFREEAQRVQSICQDLGSRSEVRESPHYEGSKGKDGVMAHLRFAVIISD